MSQQHITLPGGFVAGGVTCGIKMSGNPDLAILAGEREVRAAMMTTRNQVTGAPVQWNRQVLPEGFGTVRAVVVNSGNANTCNGKGGLRDARTMAALTGKALGCPAEQVLVCSTGIIGHRLPMHLIRYGIQQAAGRLGREDDALVARAILTTDLVSKSAVARGQIGGRQVTVAGICKGSGMIAPSMATMLAYITTDADVEARTLGGILRLAAGRSFNAITVDSDMSTSDTVLLLASGEAGNRPVKGRGEGFDALLSLVWQVCRSLALQIVRDGEGATKTIEIRVCGARSEADAEAAAKSVANSPLFKCAMHGGDPNWGRIAAALGKSSAKIDQDALVIRVGGKALFRRGGPVKFDVQKVTDHLQGESVLVECDLGLGQGAFTAWTCDLSHQYVTINADYHT